MQSALQAQIDRHGQYAFKDGSRVVNGELSLNIEYDYIKIEASFTHSSTAYTSAGLQNFVGSVITGTSNSGNQVTATVLQAITATDASNPDTLYIKYQKSGGTNSTVEVCSGRSVCIKCRSSKIWNGWRWIRYRYRISFNNS